MVIGNGMIAKRFSNYTAESNLLIFASGISNSSGATPEECRRETLLLLNAVENNLHATFVYFSTCSIYDPSLQNSLYVNHKLRMEELIQQHAVSYMIFRVSNPVGITSNQHTVLNFFAEHIRKGSFFELWKYASRNLIDIDDMFALCQHIIQNGINPNSIINIANPVNYPVTSIVEAIEKHFGCTGNYALLEKGNSPLIDTSSIQPLFSLLHLIFNPDYPAMLLQKYFPVT
jgi:nucleoside-diphosphate-sugar epimerase